MTEFVFFEGFENVPKFLVSARKINIITSKIIIRLWHFFFADSFRERLARADEKNPHRLVQHELGLCQQSHRRRRSAPIYTALVQGAGSLLRRVHELHQAVAGAAKDTAQRATLRHGSTDLPDRLVRYIVIILFTWYGAKFAIGFSNQTQKLFSHLVRLWKIRLRQQKNLFI